MGQDLEAAFRPYLGVYRLVGLRPDSGLWFTQRFVQFVVLSGQQAAAFDAFSSRIVG
jgi:hypothetical protein